MMKVFSKDWKSIFRSFRNGNFTGAYRWFYRRYFDLTGHSGDSVTDREWDYLIILDACRYDIFKEVNWLEGDLSKFRSMGSHSVEFLNKNFSDYYYNTVYVTANPHVSNVSTSTWADEQFISEDHFPYVNDVYNKTEYDEDGVTTPEGVTEEALRTREIYPDSKMIIHYMQPHAPFIGDDSECEGMDIDLDLDDQKVREYVNNLIRALKTVEDLIEELEGRIVITGDHGELLEEYGLDGHPPNIYFDELVEVPWFVIEK